MGVSGWYGAWYENCLIYKLSLYIIRTLLLWASFIFRNTDPHQQLLNGVSLDVQQDNISVSTEHGLSLTCYRQLSDVCIISWSGSNLNGTIGLLGTNDLEGYTDRRKPDGTMADTSLDLVSKYAVSGPAECYRTSEPKPETRICNEELHTKCLELFDMINAPYRSCRSYLDSTAFMVIFLFCIIYTLNILILLDEWQCKPWSVTMFLPPLIWVCTVCSARLVCLSEAYNSLQFLLTIPLVCQTQNCTKVTRLTEIEPTIVNFGWLTILTSKQIKLIFDSEFDCTTSLGVDFNIF